MRTKKQTLTKMAYEGLQLNNVHVMQSSICRSTACCFSFPDKKRQRTTFSPVQVSVLEELFTQTQYPDIFLREKISQKISLCEARIQVWFQNRRARWRREFRKKYGNFPWPRGRVSSVYHGTQSTDVVLSSTAATTPEESLYSRTLLDLYARHKNESMYSAASFSIQGSPSLIPFVLPLGSALLPATTTTSTASSQPAKQT